MTTKEVITQLESLVSEAEYNIERADKLDKKDSEYVFVKDKVALEYAIKTIKGRKKGRWLEDKATWGGWFECSNCGAFFCSTSLYTIDLNYCPKCGADMRPEEEEKK